MPVTPAQRAATVRRLAQRLGFSLLGIAPAQASDQAEHVKQWLAAGRHGEMSYMEAALEERLDPRKLLPGARSVICVADRYATKADESAVGEEGGATNAIGRIARYAWGDDYHRVMKKRLHQLADALREAWPDHEYRTTVDTAPILEREQALRAGMGWVGKNTLLIHPKLGSYMLLGEIVTTLPIETAGDTGQTLDDHCGTCRRCIDACPTGCIDPTGYQIDASRCISYLTLEHRGPIDATLHEAMGDWVAGCDVCQEVCPFNQERGGSSEILKAPASSAAVTDEMGAETTPKILPPYRPRPPAPGVRIVELLQWDAAKRQRAFERSALKRVRLDQLKRNALIVAGNYLAKQRDPALHERLLAIAADASEPDLVRETARQTLARLGPRA